MELMIWALRSIEPHRVPATSVNSCYVDLHSVGLVSFTNKWDVAGTMPIGALGYNVNHRLNTMEEGRFY